MGGMDPFRRARMIVQQIRALGPRLSDFIEEFADCFVSRDTLLHLKQYVKGQLSKLKLASAGKAV